MASSGTQIHSITPGMWSSFSYFKMITQVPDLISVFKAEGWRKGQWVKKKGDHCGVCCGLWKLPHDTSADIGQSLVTWLHFVVRDAGNCSLYSE